MAPSTTTIEKPSIAYPLSRNLDTKTPMSPNRLIIEDKAFQTRAARPSTPLSVVIHVGFPDKNDGLLTEMS